MYQIEHVILAIAVIISLSSLLFIPKDKADRASFIFLITQCFSWILGLVVVELGWLDYPVREFSKANNTSFIFEFFILPILTIFFILYYPNNKSLQNRLLYFFTFVSAFTLVEFLVEKYTLVIDYHSWDWYWTWTSMLLLFYTVRIIYRWFYHINNVFSL